MYEYAAWLGVFFDRSDFFFPNIFFSFWEIPLNRYF